MREILFRGKRVDNGEWIYGDVLHNSNCVKIREDEAAINYIARSYPVDPETIGQYTGLTDKNGTKIFERDIIHGTLGNFAVRWSEYIGAFVAGISTKIMPCLNRGTMKCYEVIGNIHDNPELLEGKS